MNYSEAARLAKLFQSLADSLYWEESQGHGYPTDTEALRAQIDEALGGHYAKAD